MNMYSNCSLFVEGMCINTVGKFEEDYMMRRWRISKMARSHSSLHELAIWHTGFGVSVFVR